MGYLQLILIIVVIGAAIFFARAPDRIERDAGIDPAIESSRPYAVEVMPQPQMQNFSVPIRLTGNVSFEERVEIVSEARGKIVWVSEKFRGGETIAANDVIVRIDPEGYRLRVKAAQARLRLAKAKLASIASSDQGYEQAAARADLAEAKLAMAQRRLAQTEVSLPYEFRVIRADAAVGDLAGPPEYVGRDGALLGAGYRPELLQIGAPVEPHLLDNLDPLAGRPATATIENVTYDVTLERVLPVVARESRMTRSFFKFDQSQIAGNRPLPGMFAEISFEGEEYRDAFALPLAAMQSSTMVWVVANGTVQSRYPQALALTDTAWIVKPFDVADGLVVGAHPNLYEGAPVTAAEIN